MTGYKLTSEMHWICNALICVRYSGICSIRSSPNAKVMPFVAGAVMTAILNGHGKLVRKEISSDWQLNLLPKQRGAQLYCPLETNNATKCPQDKKLWKRTLAVMMFKVKKGKFQCFNHLIAIDQLCELADVSSGLCPASRGQCEKRQVSTLFGKAKYHKMYGKTERYDSVLRIGSVIGNRWSRREPSFP